MSFNHLYLLLKQTHVGLVRRVTPSPIGLRVVV